MSGFNIKQAAIVGVSLLFGFVVGKGPEALKKENKAPEATEAPAVSVTSVGFVRTAGGAGFSIPLEDAVDIFNDVSRSNNGVQRSDGREFTGGYAENLVLAELTISTPTDTFLVAPETQRDGTTGMIVVSNRQMRDFQNRQNKLTLK